MNTSEHIPHRPPTWKECRQNPHWRRRLYKRSACILFVLALMMYGVHSYLKPPTVIIERVEVEKVAYVPPLHLDCWDGSRDCHGVLYFAELPLKMDLSTEKSTKIETRFRQLFGNVWVQVETAMVAQRTAKERLRDLGRCSQDRFEKLQSMGLEMFNDVFQKMHTGGYSEYDLVLTTTGSMRDAYAEYVRQECLLGILPTLNELATWTGRAQRAMQLLWGKRGFKGPGCWPSWWCSEREKAQSKVFGDEQKRQLMDDFDDHHGELQWLVKDLNEAWGRYHADLGATLAELDKKVVMVSGHNASSWEFERRNSTQWLLDLGKTARRGVDVGSSEGEFRRRGLKTSH